MDDAPFPPKRPFPAPPEPPGPRAVDLLPVAVDARRRLARVLAQPHRPSEVIAAVEQEPALLIHALRAANAGEGHTASTGAQAVAVLGDVGLRDLVEGVPVYDPLQPDDAWGLVPQRFRAHAIAVRDIAARLAADLQLERAGELVAATTLHDIGRVALERAEPGYARRVPADASPEERVAAEREAFALDHAELGGWIAREWRLPEPLAAAIESHHRDRLGLAAFVRIADMLAHARMGRQIDAGRLATTVAVAGIAPSSLRAIVMELPPEAEERDAAPSPLSEREREVLVHLSDGLVPKQIAVQLGVAEATVRSHLHRIYQRIGVPDRTQAVLRARDQGWI